MEGREKNVIKNGIWILMNGIWDWRRNWNKDGRKGKRSNSDGGRRLIYDGKLGNGKKNNDGEENKSSSERK